MDGLESTHQPADCAEMCAKLNIDWKHLCGATECSSGHIKQRVNHNGSQEEKMKAWMYAATLVAARIGGYKDEN